MYSLDQIHLDLSNQSSAGPNGVFLGPYLPVGPLITRTLGSAFYECANRYIKCADFFYECAEKRLSNARLNCAEMNCFYRYFKVCLCYDCISLSRPML